MKEKKDLATKKYMETKQAVANLFLVNQENVSTLYLIRHGEDEMPAAENNYDQPLTPLGVINAHNAGKRLKSCGITQLFSSPCRRTLQTADIIGSHIGIPTQIDTDLREISPTSDFENYAYGLNENAKLWNKNEWHIPGKFNRFYWKVEKGVESQQAVRRRAVKVIDSLFNKYAGQKIAAVSHYAFINVYISVLLGLDSDAIFFINGTGISTIKAHGHHRALISLNDASHTSA